MDKLAEEGQAGRFQLPIARCRDGSLDFSYSGLKTKVLQATERLEREGKETDLGQSPQAAPEALDLIADFRQAAVGQLLDRLTRLWDDEPFELLAVSGGVAANRLLRREAVIWGERHGVDVRLVPLAYAGDNAAMIAHAALLRYRRGEIDNPLLVEAASRVAMGR